MKLTDSTGTVKSRTEYAPYGQAVLEWSASGDTYLNTRKYTDYERDEATGLDYANARMYISSRGRFMQPDSARLNAAEFAKPESLNLYSYAGNDPINFVDFMGLSSSYWDCAYTGRFLLNDRWWSVYICLLVRDPGRKLPLPADPFGQQDDRTKEQKRIDALDKAFEALYNRPECNDLI